MRGWVKRGPATGRAVVDLAAVRHKRRGAAGRDGAGAALMTVVRRTATDTARVPVARAARGRGASWLGVCTLEEALELRAGGVEAPVLSWLHLPTDDFAPAIRAGAIWGCRRAPTWPGAGRAREAGRPARLHLKIDTG